MDPNTQRDHVDTSLGVKPRLGPREQTAHFSFLMITSGVMLDKRPHLLKVSRF